MSVALESAAGEAREAARAARVVGSGQRIPASAITPQRRECRSGEARGARDSAKTSATPSAHAPAGRFSARFFPMNQTGGSGGIVRVGRKRRAACACAGVEVVRGGRCGGVAV